MTRFPPQGQTRRTTVLLSPAEDRILQALNRYHFLTAKQVCRLFYKAGSLTLVRSRLKAMTDGGFLKRKPQPRVSSFGRLPEVYTLARRGLTYLTGLGLDVQHRFRPQEANELGFHLLSHTLAINDFLIAAELLAATTPELTLAGQLHDLALKRTPTRVELPDGKMTTVVPDAWLDLHLMQAGQTHQFPLSVEVDRGTRERKCWQEKIRALLSFAGKPYREAFGTAFLTIAVVATPGTRRRDELLRWTEAVIGSSAPDAADLFRFTDALADELSPHELFFSPVWVRPFERVPRALLPMGGGG
jgi:hypothetical protein